MRSIMAVLRSGFLWAVGWTLVGMTGVIIFYTLFPDAPDVVDLWIPVFAYPGFLCGVLFSALLRVAEPGRPVDELSPARRLGWGGIAGILVGLLPFVLGTPTARYPLWQLAAAVIGSTTLLSGLSALASGWLSRTWKRTRAAPGH